MGRRTLTSAVALATVVLAGPTPSDAQDATGWQLSLTPYLWMAATKGQVAVGSSVVDVDLSFSDVFDQLDFGVSGLFEARKARWTGRLDVWYLNTHVDQTRAEPVPGQVALDQEQLMVQPEVGYSVMEWPWGGIDALTGVRYWNVDLDLSIAPTGGAATSAAASNDWVDATIGGRLRFSPGTRVHLFAKADVGTGGSDFTWQASGGAAYDVGWCCALAAAYRHLDVEYESEEFVHDVYTTGPALGLQIRF
jgi:hypothetical protein